MPETLYIEKHPALRTDQDYALLKRTGIAHIEAMASAQWTDYNVHDPGITLLEALCYAITDLGYRTDYDIADLLTREDADGLFNAGDFHTARDVFSSSPVTFDDLRKVLIDVKGVRNAWIEPHESVVYHLHAGEPGLRDAPEAGTTPNVPIAGLYDVHIEYDDYVQDTPRRIHMGLTEQRPDGGGDYGQALGRGLRFNVTHPCHLLSVRVYARHRTDPTLDVPLTVELRDAEDTLVTSVEATIPAAQAEQSVCVPLDFQLQPGDGYRLLARGAVAELYRESEVDFPFTVDGVLEVDSGVHGTTAQAPYFFFYDWQVHFTVAPEGPVSVPFITEDDVRLAVLDRIQVHRSLCQDVVNVCELDREEIGICADLEVAPSADVEDVHAEIFYRLEQHISPLVQFYTIDELLDRGKTTDEIFEGPLLDHGFIDDDEFQAIQRRKCLYASDIVQIIMDVPGITAVKSISLLSFIDGAFRVEEDWVLVLTADRFRAPSFSPIRSKLIFYKNDLPYFSNQRVVGRLLADKKARDLQPRLKGHERDLPVPVGAFKDVADYYPVQNELPATYRTGAVRVPDTAPALRKAQARQLKAYLLFFEQLLANYLAQLANLDALLSWDPAHTATYFTQTAGLEEIADWETLCAVAPADLMAELDAIIEDEETRLARKQRLLEHLVARFAESFTDYSLLLFSRFDGEVAAHRVIEGQQAFLSDYPRLSRERSKGFDYRDPHDADNLTGYQRRVYRLLGVRDVARRPLAGRRFVIEELAEDQWRFVILDEDGVGPLFVSITCEQEASTEQLLDFAFTIGGDAANYEAVGADERVTADHHHLMRRCRGTGDDEVIGWTTTPDAMDPVVAYFAAYADAEGFHVVEHVLLRKRTLSDPFLPVQLNPGDECLCVEVRDPYTFRISVVLPSWPVRFQDIKFRQFVEETLRSEAPAHIYLKICWISHHQMQDFEACYFDWLDQLAALQDRLGACCLPGDSSVGMASPCAEAERVAAVEAKPPPDPCAAQRSGQLPLPPTGPGEDEDYRDALTVLIDKLHTLVTVYPLARLHNCDEEDEAADGNTPKISLNNTSLGTF